MFSGISFGQPWFLLLLVIIPIGFVFNIQSALHGKGGLILPAMPKGNNGKGSIKITMLRFLPYLRALTLAMIIIALARPQASLGVYHVASEGIDIMMATDLSKSMELQDFKPNRIEAAKKLGIEFINLRHNDRIGLVVFAGESFTLCPLTIDHGVVVNLLSNVTPDFLQNGTAIGMGLASCVDRLRESNAKSRIVILLTDGVNNSGSIDPLTAAELAVKYHVKVYTIGVGSINKGELMLPGMGGFIDSDIDEDLLKKVSKMTGGMYFRATDNEALHIIYQEIDRLEKVKIQGTTYEQKQEMFFPWLMAAFIFLGMEFLLRYVLIKTISE